MFPKCGLSEARSALSIAKGDMGEAVRLIIEGDIQLSPSPHNVGVSAAHKRTLPLCVLAVWFDGVLCLQVNQEKSISSRADKNLKESILEKWVGGCFCPGKAQLASLRCFYMYDYCCLHRYMLVDREEDKKTHRPVAPKDVSYALSFTMYIISCTICTFYVFHAIQLAFWCDFYSLQRSWFGTTVTRW